jgi:hypothetical protein
MVSLFFPFLFFFFSFFFVVLFFLAFIREMKSKRLLKTK